MKIYSEYSLHYDVDDASRFRMALYYMYGNSLSKVRIELDNGSFEWFDILDAKDIDKIVDKYFPPQKDKERKTLSLLHPEYETYNDDGNDIARDFRLLIRGFIKEKIKAHSSIELEYILTGELSCMFSEERLERNAKIYKEKRRSGK
jgi:hypothetical protein